MVTEKPDPEGLRYRRASDVRWTVETRGLAMYSPERGVFCCLPYPFAAIWDLVSRGYAFNHMVELMRHISGLDQTATRELVLRTLRNWAEMQLLVEDRDNG